MNYLEFAPVILVVMGFFIAYRIFVTPEYLQKEIAKLDERFVRKEVHDLAIQELKDDIAEIKEKVEKIYDKLIG